VGKLISGAALPLILAFLLILLLGCTGPEQKKSNVEINPLNSTQPANSIDGDVKIVYKCPNGVLVSSLEDCPGANSKVACPDGSYAQDRSQCKSCDANCDDFDDCTVDVCSKDTGYQCEHFQKQTSQCAGVAPEAKCIGGQLEGGACVCKNLDEAAINGVCKKAYCIIDWGGNKIERLKGSGCSLYYDEGSYDRKYCNQDSLSLGYNCTACGCLGGVACVNDRCQNRSALSIPADAIGLEQAAIHRGLSVVLKSVSKNTSAVFEVSDSRGAGARIMELYQGDWVVGRLSSIGYVNFTLVQTNYDLENQFKWAKVAFYPYTTPCQQVRDGKSILFSVPDMSLSYTVKIYKSTETGTTILVQKPPEKFVELNISDQIELFGNTGLYLKSCNPSKGFANMSITSAAPFDYSISLS